MDDMISRRAALDALRKMQTYKLFVGDDMTLVDQAAAMTELMMLPPALPEVLAHGAVKCRDCKHSAMIYSTNMVPVVGGFRAEWIDPIFCQCDKLSGIEIRWDDFCSHAERRSE